MGRKKIDPDTDKPDWFSVDRYSCLTRLDDEEWLNQLFLRREIKRLLKSLNEEKKLDAEDHALVADKRDKLEKIFAVLFQKEFPLIENYKKIKYVEKKSHKRQSILKYLFSYIPVTLKRNDASYAVRAITYHDIQEYYRHAPADLKKELMDNDDPRCATLNKTVINRAVYGDTIILPYQGVMINLHLKDTELKEAFSKQLKILRKPYPFNDDTEKYHKLQKNKWLNSLVIPYLDLEIWFEKLGLEVKPSNGTYARLLEPLFGRKLTLSTLKETLKTNAKKAIDIRTLNQFRYFLQTR